MSDTQLDERERKEVNEKLTCCADNMDHLDSWEQNFIENIADLVYRTNQLTDRQLDKLNEVYEKVR